MEQIKWVEYHSKDWELLVEMGWVTMDVQTAVDNGTRVAKMLLDGKRR